MSFSRYPTDYFRRALRFARSRGQNYLDKLRPKLIYGLAVQKGCRISSHVVLRVVDGGECFIGANTIVGRFCEITAGGGVITIGSNTFIGQGSIIVSKSRTTIGNDCLIAEQVTIRDQNHIVAPGRLVRESGFEVQDIEIGDNVWIGAKVCILAGVTIGSGCVIGAGSVVTRNIPPHTIAVGNPARIIRQIELR